jgi:hypothetical protein
MILNLPWAAPTKKRLAQILDKPFFIFFSIKSIPYKTAANSIAVSVFHLRH